MRLQKRCYSSHANSGEGIVASKTEALAMSKNVPARTASQIKSLTSLFVELVKTTTPSFQISLSNLTKRIPFPNFQTDDNVNNKVDADKSAEQNNGPEIKTSKSSYFDLLVRSKEKSTAPTVPHWKLKKKAICQESIDARTKYVVSAVAKAGSKSSLLMRLEDLCRHLFQYPQAKSLASRVRLLVFNTYCM